MSQSERFLQACRSQQTDCTPVWLMRQAGRYMEEYRKLREQYPIMTLCKTPELAARVTLQPIRRFNLDAAIIFADILLPLEPLGLKLEFAKGEGPVIYNPIRTTQDVEQLRPVEPEESLKYVLDAIRIVRRELDGKIPLIGFAGAPFTMASYMIEGGSSKNYLHAKSFMYYNPDAWHKLMNHLALIIRDYLLAQVRFGAQAVQLFDSWAGILSPSDYKEYVFPYSRLILESVAQSGVPVIHFGTDTLGLLPCFKEAGGDVIGVDWRVSLTEARLILGENVVLQGNLDPALLFAPLPVMKRNVERILREAYSGADMHTESLLKTPRGFIFNLGHGVLQETPVNNVEALINMVHELSSGGIK